MVKLIYETSFWFWFLMLTMIALGFRQSKSRNVKPGNIVVISFLMLGLSFIGLICTFTDKVIPLIVWSLSLFVTFLLVRKLGYPGGWHFDPIAGSLMIPGSWVPFVLIISIFTIRLFVRYLLLRLPSLNHIPEFSLSIGMVYGLFSGIFFSRTWHAIRLSVKK